MARPETERFGLAVRVAVTKDERHALVQRAPSRLDDFLTPATRSELRHDVVAPIRAFAFVQHELDACHLRILQGARRARA